MPWIPFLLAVIVVSGVAGYWYFQWQRARFMRRERRHAQARHDFRFQRERLEAKFVQLAKERIDPANWLWEDAEFDDQVAFAKHRFTGELSAYVAVTVERIRPNLLKTLAGTATNIRSATVVFQFDGERWNTHGRAILNLSPEETVHLYKRELQLVEQEPVIAEDDLQAID